MVKTSLYRAYSADEELLYVGISISFLTRLGQHRRGAFWFEEVATIKVRHFDSRAAAAPAEASAIVAEKPRYNAQHSASPPKREEPQRITSLDELHADKDPDGKPTRFISSRELRELFPLPNTTSAGLIKDPTFPRAVRLGNSAARYWRFHEVQAWVRSLGEVADRPPDTGPPPR